MKKYFLFLCFVNIYASVCAQSPQIEMADFLQNVMYEGLKADAFPKAIVKIILDNEQELFVPKCQICENVKKGLRKYTTEKGKKSKNNELSRTLEKGTKSEKQQALQTLVAKYIKQYRAKHPLTPAEAKVLDNALEVAKKNGMQGLREDFGSYSCPSCEGANVK
jgi:type I site-specific restriction-modification system R (restriction) subunit